MSRHHVRPPPYTEMYFETTIAVTNVTFDIIFQNKNKIFVEEFYNFMWEYVKFRF